MFKYDKPILSKTDDFLSREAFSEHLGQSLLSWEEKESLVLALYGEWGSGKSSVINLAKEYIDSSPEKDKPTIIEFNPWVYSDLDNLSKNFFYEIAKELELKRDDEKDKIIAEKLKSYAKLLQIIPEGKVLSDLSSKVLIGLGLLSVSTSQVIQWLNIPHDWIKFIVFGFGLILFLLGMFKDVLLGLSDFFTQRIANNITSLAALKEDIKQDIRKRKKKLIIIIDDVDRLNRAEIRQIFRLVRVNADFPNTIYLLAFAREIVVANLEEQAGVSGKDYLGKIVQVSFDVPVAKSETIAKFLFQELDRVMKTLPDSHDQLFDQKYWSEVYHSGFKDLFKNIRDVKRYSSSLQFNISQMHQKGVMEVNPIDFIAVEAIRIFVPNYYRFIKLKKSIFTGDFSTDGSLYGDNGKKRDEVAKLINDALDLLDPNLKESIKKLTGALFPQLAYCFSDYGAGSYGHEWQSEWSRKLRVCANNNFDSYFTLIPGGNEEELSQYEIVTILGSMVSAEKLEDILVGYIKNIKIKKVLQRLQDYTGDIKDIPSENVENVVQALFDISDLFPEDDAGFFEVGSDMEAMRIIYQLFKREEDLNVNFEILKSAIPKSKGISGPFFRVSLETSTASKKEDYSRYFDDDQILELQKLCIQKVNGLDYECILGVRDFLHVLYRWKDWDEDSLNDFVAAVLEEDDLVWKFLPGFISKTKSSSGDYGYEVIKKFSFKSLEDFVPSEQIQIISDKVKYANSNPELYDKHQELIDLFLAGPKEDDF